MTSPVSSVFSSPMSLSPASLSLMETGSDASLIFPDYDSTVLAMAVLGGDAAQVESMVNFRDRLGETALYILAAMLADEEIELLKALLDYTPLAFPTGMGCIRHGDAAAGDLDIRVLKCVSFKFEPYVNSLYHRINLGRTDADRNDLNFCRTNVCLANMYDYVRTMDMGVVLFVEIVVLKVILDFWRYIQRVTNKVQAQQEDVNFAACLFAAFSVACSLTVYLNISQAMSH
ncbi:hypothetical protein LA080_007189 [Diaporthe eres]|nr:hypothetical protein LA080_007189 [Diaporthe eres]